MLIRNSKIRPTNHRNHHVGGVRCWWPVASVLLAGVMLPAAILVWYNTNNSIALAGPPQDGKIVFQEDFTSGTPAVTTVPESLDSYHGGPLASYTGYTADEDWLPITNGIAQNRCNGWLLNFNSPSPTSAQDSGCTSDAGEDGNGNQQTSWWYLSRMASELGTVRGLADPTKNNVLASMTNPDPHRPQTGKLQLATTSPLPLVAGHYYVLSVWLAQVHCHGDPNLVWTNAEENLTLVGRYNDGRPYESVENDLDPCNGVRLLTDNNTPVFVADLQSPIVQLPSDINIASLSLQIKNDQLSDMGNDVAFDMLTITDVTPQLSKEFSPGTMQRGAISVLTYMITNTKSYTSADADYVAGDVSSLKALAAKPNWNFTDNLPAGVVAAGVPTSSDCDNFSGSVSVNGSTVLVAGNLAVDQESCTVSLPVKVATVGTFINGASNFPYTNPLGPACSGGPDLGLCGLLPPEDATLQVTPSNLEPDVATTPYETPIQLDVLSNDNVPTGSTVTIVTPVNPIQGDWVNNHDGTVTFTPAQHFSGLAEATYQVTLPDGSTLSTTIDIYVKPSADLPILMPDAKTTLFGVPVTVNVLDNDKLLTGSMVSDVIPNDPTEGSWTFDATGNVTFTPADGFSGQAIATYVVTYPGGTTMSTVTITVAPQLVSPSPTTIILPGVPDTGLVFSI